MLELMERALDHAVNLVYVKQTFSLFLELRLENWIWGHILEQKNQSLRKDDVKTRKNAEGNLNVSV